MNDQQWLDKWNHNFSNPEYIYGREPNRYFAGEIAKLPPGRILLGAEGEGRNAVHAARLGWQASAFDISATGRDKALQLAKEHNITLDYHFGELPTLPLPAAHFDAIALIYAHFPPPLRAPYHRHLATLLRPGGTLILEAFAKSHLPYRQKDSRIGGPANIEALFSPEEIRDDFQTLDIIHLQETEITLNEGLLHNGTGSVIRLIARQPE